MLGIIVMKVSHQGTLGALASSTEGCRNLLKGTHGGMEIQILNVKTLKKAEFKNTECKNNFEVEKVWHKIL